MFKLLCNVFRYRTFAAIKEGASINSPRMLTGPMQISNYSNVLTCKMAQEQNACGVMHKSILLNPKMRELVYPDVPSRNLTKFTLQKGKRRSVKSVITRFYRLNWGGWIRTIAGRHSQMWKKSVARRKRIRRHVFCNGTQSWLLDSMVTNYWRKPKYYVDDPYEPYHTREEFAITSRKPRPRS